MQTIGKIFDVRETQQRSESFAVREFILFVENTQNPQYSDYVIFQLTNQNCSLIDSFQVGQEVQITFNIRGRKWQGQDGRIAYFNTLIAYKIDLHASQQQAAPIQYQQPAPTPQQYQQPMQGVAMPANAQQQYQSAPVQQMAQYAQQNVWQQPQQTQQQPQNQIDNGGLPF